MTAAVGTEIGAGPVVISVESLNAFRVAGVVGLENRGAAHGREVGEEAAGRAHQPHRVPALALVGLQDHRVHEDRGVPGDKGFHLRDPRAMQYNRHTLAEVVASSRAGTIRKPLTVLG